MYSIYTEKEEEIPPILKDLRLPGRRSEQHERSCKLKHIILLGIWRSEDFQCECGCWLQSLKEVLIIRLENIGISGVGVNVCKRELQYFQLFSLKGLRETTIVVVQFGGLSNTVK